jgi:hypothetical protein
MVLTSLSLHLIALLIIMLTPGHPVGSGRGNEPEPPGPVVILSKELSPDRASPPPSHPLPPPPPPAAVIRKPTTPPPAPAPEVPASAEAILAGNGGPHLNGGVVFLLDISGSMYEAYAGATRLAMARKLIRGQIEALPEGTPFAITLYGETTRRSGPLVRADRATRNAAEQYLMEDFDLGGGTNLPAGFDTAEELHPGSIVLVSDGDLNIADDMLLKETRRILGQPGPQLSVIGVAPRAGTVDAQQLEEVAHQQAGSYQTMVPRMH